MALQSTKPTAERVRKHNQGHLLAFLDELNEAQRGNLLDQLDGLPWSSLPRWIEQHVKTDHSPHIPDRLKPAPSFPPVPRDGQMTKKYAEACALGETLIAQGKVGAFVVAGGQGTRLGFGGPKGAYPISPIKEKSLFQMFAEQILATSKRYGAACPWYIMTSPLNHAQTQAIIHKNDFYGLDPETVFMFQQGTLPNFSLEGKILLSAKDRVASSPDGHGGSLRALFARGATADMSARGLDYLSYWQVDNPLIKVFDPLFIGLHVLEEAEMSSKAITKTGPMEKVGNFCQVDGKIRVIEYSDLPDPLARQTKDDGFLVFELGNIGIHMVNRTFVERLNVGEFSLPIQRAVKKIPYVDPSGERIDPQEPNGVKLETFVFDALPLASKSIVLQTVRAEEFGPVKNATGVDSAETSRQMQSERAVAWLEAAGLSVPRQDQVVQCTVEIAPSFALSAQDVEARVDQIPPIKPGDRLYLA